MIDTHCHLDFLSNPAASLEAAHGVGVEQVVVPAVGPENFDSVRQLSRENPGVFYALGLHPCSVDQMKDDALTALEDALRLSAGDPGLVAVGEIGLDHYVPGLDWNRMETIFWAQLRLAREWDLPVVLHIRKAQDLILKGLRRFGIRSGIAHAFNGSESQAQAFIRQGLKLGFGGAMTFARAHQIRRHAAHLPLEALVLETDSPDMAPAWLPRETQNEPIQIPRIAACLAELRGVSVEAVVRATTENAAQALPGLRRRTDH